MARFNMVSAKNNYDQEVSIQKAKAAFSVNPMVKTITFSWWDKDLKHFCIRAIKRNGEIWLFASDVCGSIEYKNPSGLRVYMSQENYGIQKINGKEHLLINHDGMKQLKGRLSKKKTANAYNELMVRLERDVFAETQQSTPQAKEEDITKYIKDNDESIGDILSTLINCYKLLIDALKTLEEKRGEV